MILVIEKLLKEAAREGVIGAEKKDGGPFGAVIVSESGEIISRGHNKVLSSHDPTNHAEIVAIREACSKLGTEDLSGYVMYSSCEPCLMCLSAIIWSNIKTLYYGATRDDAARAGFRDDAIYKFIAGENNILDRKFMDNWDCKEILDNYEGEIY